MFSPDYKEFVALLNANEVKYLVVGAYAVALHGYPRYTKDLDVWIERTEENARRLLDALEMFGFGSLGLSREDFLEEGHIIQLGYPPNRIDLITSANGLDFEKCYTNRVRVEIQNLQIDFIDKDDLKKNKKATGRPQDLADLVNLEDD